MKKIFSRAHSLLNRYGRLLDKFVYTKIEDACSMRNTLVILTCIFCFMALRTKDSAIIAVVFGVWATIVSFYFYHRQKTQNNGGIKTSNFDEETKKDDTTPSDIHEAD